MIFKKYSIADVIAGDSAAISSFTYFSTRLPCLRHPADTRNDSLFVFKPF